MLLVARALADRGHKVLLMSDEATRAAADRSGVAFRPWTTAPNRLIAAAPNDPLSDWRHLWPPAVVRSLCEAVIARPSDAYARDLLATAQAFEPDLVITNELLFGVIAACEARRSPVAILTANLWCFPDRPDNPPFGPGWAPADSPFEVRREALGRAMIARWYDAGLRDLNRTRTALGLKALPRLLDQLHAVGRRVLGVSAAFDFAGPSPDYAYAGPLMDIASAETPHPLIDPARRNVLITFSTTFQNQTGLMRRCAKALGRRGLNIVVTTGPAVSPGAFAGLADVKSVDHAPHDALVPFCDLVICHGGHGTLMRPLMAGKPVLCLPMGRDHADNGARLQARGAGKVLTRWAPSGVIRRAALELLETPAYAQAAQTLGAQIRETAAQERASAIRTLEAFSEGR